MTKVHLKCQECKKKSVCKYLENMIEIRKKINHLKEKNETPSLILACTDYDIDISY